MLKNAGINNGFVITEVDGKKIKTLDQLEDVFETMDKSILVTGKYRKGKEKTIEVEF